MDPIALGIVASIVTVVAFIYMLIFGQRGLVDWLERRRQATSPRSLEEPAPAIVSSHQDTKIHQPANSSAAVLTELPSARIVAHGSNPSWSSPPATLTPSASQERTTMDRTAQEFVRHIASDIEAKKCVFLLGAGVSIEAGLPSGSELAEMLTRRAGWDSRDRSLQQVAQDYATVVGPVKPVIHDYLRQRLEDPAVGSTDAHRTLACMADKLDTILTTNWDDLLENAFAQARIRQCQIVYRDAHMSTREPVQAAIVKLHGHIDDPDSYVVTQQDYLAFRTHNPQLAAFLRSCLTSSTLVIIGYGQEDEDFRQIYDEALQDLTPGQERRHVYVINPREDVAWEQYWRDSAHERFIRMTASDFLTAVYHQVATIVNRNKELELGRDLIPGPHKRPVVEFHGIPGVGKTTLLKAIRREYDKRPIHTAVINFEIPDLCEEGKASRRLIWDDIGRQLGTQARYEDKEELRNQLRRKRSVTLFFDTVDHAPRDTIRWLGETYISLMDDLPGLRAVFACRSSMLSNAWGYPLRLKVDTRHLTPFQRFADTHKQMVLAFFHDEALARQVYDLTLGHPGMVQRIIEWLKARRIKGHKDLDAVAKAELGRHVDTLLETYILKDIEDELKPLIRQLAYYRWFFWGDVSRIRQRPVSEGKEFIHDKLWPTGLFEQGLGPRPSFAVDRTVRELFLNVTLLQDTAQFIAIAREIGNQREIQATRMTETWHLYVIECLYHRINELRGRQLCGQAVDMPAVLLLWFDAQIQKMVSKERILDLQEILQGDDDLASLMEQVYAGLYPALLQAVEARKNTLGA